MYDSLLGATDLVWGTICLMGESAVQGDQETGGALPGSRFCRNCMKLTIGFDRAVTRFCDTSDIRRSCFY